MIKTSTIQVWNKQRKALEYYQGLIGRDRLTYIYTSGNIYSEEDKKRICHVKDDINPVKYLQTFLDAVSKHTTQVVTLDGATFGGQNYVEDLRIGLLFFALVEKGELLKQERHERIIGGIEEMSAEEVMYWFDVCLGKAYNSSKALQGRHALRVLFATNKKSKKY